jgi:hypothetical protein
VLLLLLLLNRPSPGKDYLEKYGTYNLILPRPTRYQLSYFYKKCLTEKEGKLYDEKLNKFANFPTN